MAEILSKLVYVLIGAALSHLFAELTRARRKMRLLVRSAQLPIIVLTH